MTTPVLKKKICSVCTTNAAVVTCNGCQRPFCHQHSAEHREEISQQMNELRGKCESYRRSLPEENDPAPLLSAIDKWESESIEKVRIAANFVRQEIQKNTEQLLEELNDALDSITNDMEASSERNDATEIDLKYWSKNYQKLESLLQQPFPISLTGDENPPTKVRFIKTTYESPVAKLNLPKGTRTGHPSVHAKAHTGSYNSNSNTALANVESRSSFIQESHNDTEERFHQFAGHVKLAQNGLIATCYGYSSIWGIKLYASGVHRIQLRVMNKKNDGLFIGISTSTEKLTARATEVPSAYGWRDFNRPIIDSNAELNAYRSKNIEPGDQLTLTINCDHSELTLAHHRLKRKIKLSVDVRKCQLPWKFLISSFGEDVISILR